MDDWGYDRKLIRRYKAWIKQHNDLWDWAGAQGEHEQWTRYDETDLQEMRNGRQSYVTRYSFRGRPFEEYNREPTYDCFFSHFTRDFPFTLYLTNGAYGQGTIYVYGDIDNKVGDGDVDRAVRHVTQKYGITSCFVEPSTRWLGRHLGFLLDIQIDGADDALGARADIWSTFDMFTALVQDDPIWDQTGCTFDGFFGRPTLWKKADTHLKQIERRGDAFKAPRVQSIVQMEQLESLVPVSLQRLQDALSKQVTKVILLPIHRQRAENQITSQGVLVSASLSRCVDAADMTGDQKKKLCISEVLRRTDGECDVDDVYAEYVTRWSPNPNKCPKERRGQIAGYFKGMQRRFRKSGDARKYPFKSGEFLSMVRATVPPHEFDWVGHNRARISPAKLADFIGLKTADAFYPKGWEDGWFARTAQKTTIANSRKLHAKKQMDWVVTPNTYKVLLSLSEKYGLLHVYEPFVPPIVDPRTKTKLVKGKARLIGPGTADAMKVLRSEWLPLYRQHQRRLWTGMKIAA